MAEAKRTRKKDSRKVRIEQLSAESATLKDRICRLEADQYVMRAKLTLGDNRAARLDRLLALLEKDFAPTSGPAKHILSAARSCVREMLPYDAAAPMEQTGPNTQAQAPQ